MQDRRRLGTELGNVADVCSLASRRPATAVEHAEATAAAPHHIGWLVDPGWLRWFEHIAGNTIDRRIPTASGFSAADIGDPADGRTAGRLGRMAQDAAVGASQAETIVRPRRGIVAAGRRAATASGAAAAGFITTSGVSRRRAARRSARRIVRAAGRIRAAAADLDRPAAPADIRRKRTAVRLSYNDRAAAAAGDPHLPRPARRRILHALAIRDV